jgi:acyl transferase domain-containing protein/enoyl-CoA hydratase/carnithine racemase/acyl carrier protein
MSIKGDVAVIGMAGRFPGASSVAEFWANLCAKKDGVRTLGDDELRAAGVDERELADADYVKTAALLDGVDRFDPAFFKISPREAQLMDPQIRLLLQCAWETLEDAGYARRDAQRIGVFAGAGGVTTSYFANFINRSERFEKITAGATHLGNDKDFLATYLSYKLNLTGPGVTVQTACSTSLVALHQARLSLLAGECDMALAGGVTVRVPHVQGYRYREGYIFSRSGRVRAFDADADGVVFGSGLGLVLIKRLAAAIADGDHIHAVIKGSAIGNDGKGKMSYAASSAKGQIACVRAALDNAGVDAGTLGFVESHGTGTAMGDPEEVKALSAAFRTQTDRKSYCALGAVKSNIGHLEAAAGIAGFIKAVLAVKHGVVPPTLHYAAPNKRICFGETPFHVNTELLPWDAGKAPRRAAVNSLGVGGTNAFVVIENHVAPKRAARKKPAGPSIVPLSARTGDELDALVRRYLDFLGNADTALPELADVAFTLQTGRDAMECRVAFVVDSFDALRAALARHLAGESQPTATGPAAELAATWAAGGTVDWVPLHAGRKPQRASLPVYAFAQERCWIDETDAAPSRAVLHPLLHANVSDLNEQKYRSSFTGDEDFLRDHRVRTRASAAGAAPRVLPGVAYLEMARAAIEQAAPVHCDTSELELRDVVWLQPIAVTQATEVDIALVARDAPQRRGGRIDFEIYTGDDRIHCQGHGTFRPPTASESIDVATLATALPQHHANADALYAAFAHMGLDYGPAHRAVVAFDRSDDAIVAQLTLPAGVASASYVLHPSLLDGALQAATALVIDLDAPPAQPVVPFALDLVRIVAPCTGTMRAWARYAAGSRRGDRAAKLDIDLTDADGKVCVMLRGFLPRALGRETAGRLLATQVWQTGDTATAQGAWAEPHVLVAGLPQIDTGRLAHDCTRINVASDAAAGYTALATACFDKLKALIVARPAHRTLVQVVLPDTGADTLGTGLAGLLKTAHLENPNIAGQVVLVDAGIDSDTLAAILHAERAHPHDTLIRHAGGERRVAAWRFVDDALDTATDSPFKDCGVYLVTGGLGGLGTLFAYEILARTAAATVVLTGRASTHDVDASPELRARLDALRASGRTVEYRQMALDDAAQVDAAVAAIVERHGRINGVLHAAGMTADDFILRKDADTFGRVLAPKVAGTVHLDHATRELDLDFFVLFSSLTSAVGNIGQADYAAANGFLDAYAGLRNRQVRSGERRGRTLAIRWPLWRDGGMQPDAAAREQLRETTGIVPMQTATGLAMFYRSLASDCDQTLAMEGDLTAMQRCLGVGTAMRAVAATVDVVPVEAAAGDLTAQTEAFLCRQLATVLKLPAQRIDPRAPLEDYGIDSILALDLTRALEQAFGALPKTLFFEYLTIRDLAGYFVGAHAPALAARFATSGAAVPAPVATAPMQTDAVTSIRGRSGRASTDDAAVTRVLPNEPIAIVGIAGRYPGGADLAAFWDNLRDGKDCIVEVPRDRWDWREWYTEDRSEKGRHYSRWGGFIDGVDEFDARFFNISPVEAELVDPQERLFLQHAWAAVEDAGYSRAALQMPNGRDLPGQVGVYAGVMYGEYQLLGVESTLAGRPAGFASNPASIANRVSYVMNLHGPSMVVDTMCSSSLTAIHLACQDLKLGRTELAIAGGVNVTIHPNKYLMLSAGQFISGDGHCQSFGEGGDGYIPGEGVGVVVLKRLSDAQRDGNVIYGVIRGSALSHGGKTNGYTVPNPQAQASAIRQAFAEAGVDARHVSYLEAHGTGTKLGDPIEIAALTRVFREHTDAAGYCLVGSVKSNIGHAEAAAGVAGLSKVLLQLRHGQIAPSLHSQRLNPHIDFDATPFIVNQTLQPWTPPVVDGRTLPRIAGISSFGAGGSNAHLVIEEYIAPVAATVAGTQLVPLSARTPEQLKQKAQELAASLRRDESLSLASIAWTLQHGRDAMDERLAIVVDSTTSLVERLDAWLAGRADGDTYDGQVKANRDALAMITTDADLRATVDRWIAERRHAKLAELWVKGLEIDWALLHATRPPLANLPTYPFAKQRHWFDVAVSRPAPRGAAPVLHPLLHVNTSDLYQHSYAATFDGSEAFVTGTPGQRRLTESACLAMVRAAMALALPADAQRALELRDVAWARPGTFADGMTIAVALLDHAGDRVRFEIHTRGADETVLCQGHAEYVERPAPAMRELSSIAANERISLPAADDALAGLQAALRAALGDDAQAVSLASLRVVRADATPTVAWVRAASDADAFDIDGCDAHGNVLVTLRGLRRAGAAVSAADVTADAAPTRIDIAATAGGFDTPLVAKPDRSIALPEPSTLPPVAAATTPDKPVIALRDSVATAISTDASGVALYDHGNGILVLRIDARLTPALAGALQQALATAERAPSIKALIIDGGEAEFLAGDADAHDHALVSGLYHAFAAFAYPTIAAVRGAASDAGFFFAALADFLVVGASARCSFALGRDDANAVLARRFAPAPAAVLADGASGDALRALGWRCPVVADADVITHAFRLGAELADKSREALRLLKPHLARELVDALSANHTAHDTGIDAANTWHALAIDDGVDVAGTAVALSLASNVMTAALHADGVLEVRMADRQARNLFSDAFSDGLREVFAHVERDDAVKVVVLTGYDNYFSSGGTPETLRAIHAGHAKFTDNNVFQLPLACRVPVIAAMQGHGIGAGWALGMYADLSLLAAESRYVSPYMAYGFTPGAGATLIFPARVGHDLARESLLTAREYAGADLAARGIHNVLPRDAVLPAALRIAHRVARESHDALVALKRDLATTLRAALPATFDAELAMHARTFVGQAATLARIEARDTAPAVAVPASRTAATTALDTGAIAADLKQMLAHELRLAVHEIGDDEPFVDLGLDSITGVTWIRTINERYATAIEAIKVYSYPTLVKLAAYVREEAEKAGAVAPAAAEPAPVTIVRETAAPIFPVPLAEVTLRSWRSTRSVKPVAAARATAIAIVGMSGRFAKARDLDAYWRNIADGRDCIDEIPAQRWDIERYFQAGEAAPGKTYSRWMGALDEHDRFDAAFFNISPREARSMDPQQRLFLEACWQGIEHAGYNPKTLAGSRCGVFVGCSAGDYHQLSRREQLSGQGFTGAAPSILAARISYFLDLHGPSLSIDTACSSSLVAIASACDSLVAGGSDLALAGGVNVMAGPAMQIMTAQVGMLSPHGRCYTFDARADGIVNGEGVGVVMLKRLADAERDGDCIYGVIEGWGVNQDGRTNGITAPNADAQTRLQHDVYTRFGIDPATIELVEAHGTGTALGDPIEVAGLKAAFATFTERTGYCALGSVKSNIGHCLTAAGVSGVLKSLLALQHEMLPPTIHFQTLNPHIALDASPFYVNDRLRQWPRRDGQPRRAAINSFGFSGTNAHLVIAEHRGPVRTTAPVDAVLVPLSARSAAQLERQARELAAFVRANGTASLARIACTLQTGREPMAERAAFVATSLADLERQLLAFADGGQAYRGRVDDGKDALVALGADSDFQNMVDRWIARREWPRLADLWVRGLAIDWNALYADGAPQRIGLPAYPFAGERHWIDAEPEAAQPALVAAPPVVAEPVIAVVPETPRIAPAQLVQQLRASLADALFMQTADIDARRSFTELGLDSIVGVEWVKAINRQFGTAISATRVYDYPNVEELAAYLHAQIGGATPAVVAAPVVAAIPAAPRIARSQIERQLAASLADALYLQASDVEPGKSFTELGLDSIVGVEWVKAINRSFGTAIVATRIYDYPTVRELAGHLLGELGVAAPVETAAPPTPTATRGSGLHYAPKPHDPALRALYWFGTAEGDFERDGEFTVSCSVDPERNISLREHVVFGEHLLPTDAWIELVAAACRTYFAPAPLRFDNVVIASPLVGAKGRATQIRVTFRRNGDALQFFARSATSADRSDERLHVQGFVAAAGRVPAGEGAMAFDVERRFGADEIPTNAGTYYAPLRSLAIGAEAATGEIRVAPHDFTFAANPFALYGALCTAINAAVQFAARRYGASDDQFLPYRLDGLVLAQELTGTDYRCHVVARHIERDAVEVRVTLVDAASQPVAAIDTLVLRRVARAALQPARPVARTQPAAAFDERVAIIGVSCRYPQSENIDAFWRNLQDGRDCVVEIPAERWASASPWYHPDPRHAHTSYSKWAGLLENIDCFDPLFFGISPAEAELIDPQQRIFLEECWKTIESAGYAPGSLSNAACGVYVGCAGGDYARVLAQAGQDTAGAAFMGTSTAILAARIAYHLNLKGPALAIDTACSSSLVALHLACESIRRGENTLALAGGINLLTTPLGHILTSRVGMPSRDGRCAAFDAGADGIVFSEGCGVVLLKSYAAAQRDGDDILGVIVASGTNQDGRTNGITAPSSRAQQQLLKQTYARFGIDARRIGYVEAHGTATALGDPIEVAALTAAFGERDAYERCALGSVKSNIGHTGFAAGIAGVAKALLCLRHRRLVPSIHYATPNPHIDFDAAPFYVNTQVRDWTSDTPRLAAVSSFGFSGTNAHVVIEEYAGDDDRPRASTGPVFVPVSARTEEALRQQVRNLLDALSRADAPTDLARIACTLQTGRDAMAHRLGVIATSLDELVARLQAHLDGRTVDGVYSGRAQHGDDTLALFAGDDETRAVIERWIAKKQLAKVAQLWVRGFDVDWSALYDGRAPKRLALPTYPFARERCWVEPAPARAIASSRLHPLVHRNTSDLAGQRYVSTFTGDEFVVADHRVQGRRVLPAVAYLEMMHAAVADALPPESRGRAIELQHLAFTQPLVVAEPVSAAVAIWPEDGGRLALEVVAGADDTLHCHGAAVLADAGDAPVLDLAALAARMHGEARDGAVLYPAFAALGLQYGPAFQGIATVRPGDGELLVELRLPDAARAERERYVLHPSLMDSALQGSIGLIDDAVRASGQPSLPFALESLRVWAPCVERMVAWVRYTADRAAASSLIKVDIDIADTDGRVHVAMRSFSSRAVADAPAFDEARYRGIVADVARHALSADDAIELG